MPQKEAQMFFGSLVLIGLSLAMDASAIAISNGIVYEGGAKQSVITALTFGLAQAIMPVLGYLAGTGLADIISSIDHWLAFILLAGIGGKMLYEGIRELKSEEFPKGDKKLPVKTLIMQAIATSIDALVIGVSFAALGVNIIQASLIIGIVTFICCMICSVLGNRFGRYIRKYATIFGGILLIIIGIKTLIEHLAG